MIQKSAPSLFRLLYFTLGSLALLIVIAIAISASFIIEIRESTNYLSQNTFPAIKKTDEIKAHNDYIINNISSLHRIDDSKVLNNSINRLINSINKIIIYANEADFKGAYSNTLAQAPEQVITLIEEQRILFNESIALTHKIIEQEKLTLNSIKKSSQILDLAIIDFEYDTITTRNQKTLDNAEIESTNLIIQDLLKSQSVIENLSLHINQASSAEEKSVVLQAKASFSQILRSISSTTATVDAFRNNQAFPKSIASLYFQHHTNDNFFSLKEIYLENSKATFENNIKIQSLLQKISKNLNRATQEATILNNNAVTQFQDKANIALTYLSVATIFIIVLLAVFLTFIIPQKVLNPLRMLTQAIIKLGNGEKHYDEFDTSTTELKKIDNALHVFVKNAIDLEQQKKELIKKNIQLDKSNESLKTFTRVSSHDLKSPLRGIRILCDMARENLDDGEHKETYNNLAHIDSRVSRLENLLDSLLQYTKAGNNEGNTITIDIAEFINTQFDLLHKPIDFKLQLDTTLSQITVHEAPFALIVRNLIDNAIKHHDLDHGKVIITIKEANKNSLEITVEDNGPGIHKDFHKRIFQPFETLKPKDQVEGSGMGLAIVSKLLKNLNVNIHIDSPLEDNRGTKFVLHWPLEP